MFEFTGEFDDEGFAAIFSFDRSASAHFVRGEKIVGMSFRSDKGSINLGVGSEYPPFISLVPTGDRPPTTISLDPISAQPLLYFKASDGNVQTVPLDKVMEAMVRRPG
jgi:hypothetical protein